MFFALHTSIYRGFKKLTYHSRRYFIRRARLPEQIDTFIVHCGGSIMKTCNTAFTQFIMSNTPQSCYEYTIYSAFLVLTFDIVAPEANVS